MERKRTWLVAGAVALVALCLCSLLVATLVTSGLLFFGEALRPSATAPPGISPTAVAAIATEIPPPAPTPTPRAEPTALSAGVLAEMDRLQEQVVELRGLHPRGEVERSLLTAEELRQHVTDDFLDDYTQQDAEDDVAVFALLGLLDSDFDLWSFYLDLYSEQIAGFYDDEVKQMYVVQDVSFDGPERLTYVHEYVHALQDQSFDFAHGLVYTDEACEADTERCAAISSLIEGDATLLEEQWLTTYATPEDIDELLDFYASFESPVYDAAPEFIKKDFGFPYLQGLEFVRHLFEAGGWEAVDAVYREPPLSTEQILHPESYPEDPPLPLEPPDLVEALGSGWREVDRNVLGEWYTRLVLQPHLPDGLAARAAEGWGGDSYLAYVNEETGQRSLVLVTIWDDLADAEEFFSAFLDYGDSRFGPHKSNPDRARWRSAEGYALLERASNQTLWILAPDVKAAQALRQAVDFPAATDGA